MLKVMEPFMIVFKYEKYPHIQERHNEWMKFMIMAENCSEMEKDVKETAFIMICGRRG
jgi:hypothetical protein